MMRLQSRLFVRPARRNCLLCVLCLAALSCVSEKGPIRRQAFKVNMLDNFNVPSNISEIAQLLDVSIFDKIDSRRASLLMCSEMNSKDRGLTDASIHIYFNQDDEASENAYDQECGLIRAIEGIQEKNSFNGRDYCVSYLEGDRSDPEGGGGQLPTYSSSVAIRYKNVVISVLEYAGKPDSDLKERVLNRIFDSINRRIGKSAG